jgi:YidC/Oxa1 family membrane protein insertase
LARELQAAYRGAGVSPFAGLLPALAQAPPLFVVYRLCVLPVIAGAPNAVLAANLLGVAMTAHAPAVIAAAGLLGGPTLVVLVLLLALLAVALTSSRQVVRRIRDGAVGEVPPSQLLLARVLPFGTVAAVLVVPVAVSIYLLTSTTWTLAERAVLARL